MLKLRLIISQARRFGPSPLRQRSPISPIDLVDVSSIVKTSGSSDVRAMHPSVSHGL